MPFNIKDKKETEFSLGLPKGFRVKSTNISKAFRKKLIFAAILSGLLFASRSWLHWQIYLPTIMYIARQSTSMRAFYISFFTMLFLSFHF